MILTCFNSGSSPFSSPADNYPPSRITNARVYQNDLEDFTKGVVLAFTAPGNDYDSGVGEFLTLVLDKTSPE